MPSEQDHFSAARQYQEYFDHTLRRIGMRAPQPILGETVNHYRRETLRQLKRTFLPEVHPLYKVQMRALKADALQALEPQVLQACLQEANNPRTVEPGQFRKIEEFDESGTIRSIRFVGPESFVRSMGVPGRRARIRNPTTEPAWFR
jgi:hypothetical protein